MFALKKNQHKVYIFRLLRFFLLSNDLGPTCLQSLSIGGKRLHKQVKNTGDIMPHIGEWCMVKRATQFSL